MFIIFVKHVIFIFDLRFISVIKLFSVVVVNNNNNNNDDYFAHHISY